MQGLLRLGLARSLTGRQVGLRTAVDADEEYLTSPDMSVSPVYMCRPAPRDMSELLRVKHR